MHNRDRLALSIVVAFALGALMLLQYWGIVVTAIVSAVEYAASQWRDIWVNLLASLIWVVAAFLFLRFRHAILQVFSRWLVGTKTTAADVLDMREKTYLANIIEQMAMDAAGDQKMYVDLLASSHVSAPTFHRVGRSNMLSAYNGITTQRPDRRAIAATNRTNLLTLLTAHRQVVLLGDSGSGKTTSVRRLVSQVAKKAIGQAPANRLIPVFVALRSYSDKTAGQPQSMLAFVRDHIVATAPFYGDVLVENLEAYLADGKLLVVLDGANELPSEDYHDRLNQIQAFITRWPRSKFIVTSRPPFDVSQLGLPVVEISPLEPQQVREFAKNLLTEKDASEFMTHILAGDERLMEACRVPYFLVLAIELFGERIIVPSGRASVLAEYVHFTTKTTIKNSPELEDRITECVSHILPEIGFHLYSSTAGNIEAEYSWMKGIFDFDIEAEIQHAENMGFLELSHDRRIRFKHQILQEYFAAVAVTRRLDEHNQDALSFVNRSDWDGVFALAAGMSSEANWLIESILAQEEPSRWAVWLAASCLRGANIPPESPSHQEVFRRLQLQLKTNNSSVIDRALRSLANLGDTQSMRTVHEFMSSQNSHIQELAYFYSHKDLVSGIEYQRIFSPFLSGAPMSLLLRLLLSNPFPEERPQLAMALARRVLPFIMWFACGGAVGIYLALFPPLDRYAMVGGNWLGVVAGLVGSVVFQALSSALLYVVAVHLFLISRATTVFLKAGFASLIFMHAVFIVIGTADRDGAFTGSTVSIAFSILAIVVDRGLFGEDSTREASSFINRQLPARWKDWLFVANFALCVLGVAYGIAYRSYLAQNLGLALTGIEYPLDSRLVALCLLVIILSYVGSSIMAGIRANNQISPDVLFFFGYRHALNGIRRSARNGQYLSSANKLKSIVLDIKAPDSIRANALGLWVLTIPPYQSLPTLAMIALGAATSDKMRAAAQREISRIAREVRLGSVHAGQSEMSIVLQLLDFVYLESDPRKQSDSTDLIAWAQDLPDLAVGKWLVAAILQRQGEFRKSLAYTGKPMAVETWNENEKTAMAISHLKSGNISEGLIILESVVGSDPLFWALALEADSPLSNSRLVAYLSIVLVLRLLYRIGLRTRFVTSLLSLLHTEIYFSLDLRPFGGLVAARVIEDAIRYNPDEAIHYRSRAELHLKNQRIENAEADIIRAEELEPRSCALRFRKSLLFLQQGDIGHAFDEALLAIQLQPHVPVYYLHLACLYLTLDQVDNSHAVVGLLIRNAKTGQIRDLMHEYFMLSKQVIDVGILNGLDAT